MFFSSFRFWWLQIYEIFQNPDIHYNIEFQQDINSGEFTGLYKHLASPVFIDFLT